MELEKKPARKQKCPHCRKVILIRSGKLITEEQTKIIDLLLRLEFFGITRKDFDEQREELSKSFGSRASVNNTVWRMDIE
jgi:hypothetical protein